MKKIKVFVDGGEGTTGLKIFERLQSRNDIEMLTIDPNLRKEPAERKKLINLSDVTFLCLPDVAAKESASLLDNNNTIIIDASTAHRTNDSWAYGFPELSPNHHDKIKTSKLIAVPGCHASGFIAIVYPLIQHQILDPNSLLSCHSITGYSGGGKGMIAEYEDANRAVTLSSPRQYAVSQTHKHLPEMSKHANLLHPPVFNPIVCDFFAGMVVSVPLHSQTFAKKITLEQLWEVYDNHYKNCRYLSVAKPMGEDVLDRGFISANDLVDTNNMQIIVCGNDDRITVSARFDNLGKGASGAAIQCMDIALDR